MPHPTTLPQGEMPNIPRNRRWALCGPIGIHQQADVYRVAEARIDTLASVDATGERSSSPWHTVLFDSVYSVQ